MGLFEWSLVLHSHVSQVLVQVYSTLSFLDQLAGILRQQVHDYAFLFGYPLLVAPSSLFVVLDSARSRMDFFRTMDEVD